MTKVRNIGIFGRRNVGKSTLINMLANQEVSIVSPVAGTTTDPVKKRIEIPEIGACNIIDTAGVGDSGSLGDQRVRKTEKVMGEIDMAILLFSGNLFAKEEKDLLAALKKYDVPVLVVHNQSDIVPLDMDLSGELNSVYGVDVVEFSCCLLDEAEQKDAVGLLMAFIIKGMLEAIAANDEKTILHGLVNKGDKIVLVCPMDSEAPQGRLILPQVMAIRDILDNEGIVVVVQPGELKGIVERNCEINGGKSDIKLIVTDSQVFKEVEPLCGDIPLTSFSILMARAKGPFDEYVAGLKHIDSLKDGDTVLMLESCTHHSTCDDIGRVKIPRRLVAYLAAGNGGVAPKIDFEFVSGLDEIPFDKEYALAVQCGGCMVTRKQLINRMKSVSSRQIPIVNYGMLLAFIGGIADKAIGAVS